MENPTERTDDFNVTDSVSKYSGCSSGCGVGCPLLAEAKPENVISLNLNSLFS